MPQVIIALEDGNDDDHGWNVHGSGLPSVHLFGSAIQVWAIAQGRKVTVEDAANAFNVRPSLVRHAVEAHYWMSVGEDGSIAHEGE